MRNFVECCLGGEPVLPEMTIGLRELLEPDDILLVCSDGIWANSTTATSRRVSAGARPAARRAGQARGEAPCSTSAPFSDNTTAAVMRWIGQCLMTARPERPRSR